MYLRPYGEGDLESLYRLDVACFAPRFRFSRAMMRRVVEARGAVVMLACEAGADGSERLLGFCLVSLESDDNVLLAYVVTLDVAYGHRRSGVGRTLMLDIEDRCRPAGVRWMVLHVSVDNGAAMALYEKLGYARAQRERDFYGTGYDAWVYRKPMV